MIPYFWPKFISFKPKHDHEENTYLYFVFFYYL